MNRSTPGFKHPQQALFRKRKCPSPLPLKKEETVFLLTPPPPPSPCALLGLKPKVKKIKLSRPRLRAPSPKFSKVIFNMSQKLTLNSLEKAGHRESDSPNLGSHKDMTTMSVLAVKTMSGLRLPTPPPWLSQRVSGFVSSPFRFGFDTPATTHDDSFTFVGLEASEDLIDGNNNATPVTHRRK